MSHPRFLGYLVSQFLGALNDNAFKLTVVLYGLDRIDSTAQEVAFSSLMTGLFPVPWLLFSQWAGYLADRFRKDRVLFMTKLPEVLSMALGVLGFYLESLPLLIGVFLLMSAQSAFFSPAKYGILPEVLAPKDLAEANGVLSMTTNVATLLGTVLGVELFSVFAPSLIWAGVAYVGIAMLGTAVTLYIPIAPPGHRRAVAPANPISTLRDDTRVLRRVPALPPAVLGLAYFSFLGSLLLAVIPVYGTSALGLSTDAAGRMLLPLVLGLASGSLLAGFLSRGRVELGLVPLGAVIMGVFSLHLLLRGTASELLVMGLPLGPVVDFAALGFGAGFFNVPLAALLQQRSPDDQKGRLIGYSNVVSNLAILAAAGCAYALSRFPNFDIHYTLLALTAVTVLGTVHIVWLMPDFLVRLSVYLLMIVLYRLRIVGANHVPRSGALFVANHVSWIDAVLVAAASGRMVRFMMFRPFYEARPLHGFFRRMHAIPVETGGSKEGNAESIERARAEIRAGHTVCIFAEGAITRTGRMLGFRRGLERIMEGLDAPIVPVCLDGLWGSLFSFEGGRVLLKRPRRFRHPIQVLFGAPLPASTSAFDVRRAVQALSAEAVELRESEFRTLPVEIVRSARRHLGRPFVSDSLGASFSYRRALLVALELRDRLRRLGARAGEPVGVLASADAGSALVNLGLLLLGAVPVNFPAQAPAAGRRALQAAGGSLVLSDEAPLDSDTDLRRVALKELLDAAPKPSGPKSWLRTLALATLSPTWFVRFVLGLDPEAVRERAVLVFSRGTSGPPKAVVLSHFNVLANLRAFRQVFDVGPEDTVLGVLPLASGFGFTGTLCLPAYVGASVIYHGDALDVAGVERACALRAPTLTFAPPAALARYARALPATSLASIQHVVTGGQPLPDDVREAFSEKFGVTPLEGYGLSECAPLISLNLPDVRMGSQHQVGTRIGSMGQPLPGVAVRVRDPESGEDLAADVPGQLWVRGPNVMSGYVGEASARFSDDGWYETGDVASIDTGGFLTIVDRAERLVAHPEGDVPLGRLEDSLRQVLSLSADDPAVQRLCVTAYRTAAGRPAIAVVYEPGVLVPERARESLQRASCPAHWIPEIHDFVCVPELPTLEGGAVDRVHAAQLAARALV